MKGSLFAALAGFALISGSAYAADMPVKAPLAPPPPPAPSWTGCYVGAGGGYGMWSQDEHSNFLSGAPDSFSSTASGRGWIATVQGGCDYQIHGAPFGRGVVIGAFADYNGTNIHGNNNISLATFPFVGNEKMSDYWAVGGRIGYLPTDNLLVYVSGGYTQARFNAYNLSFNFVGGPANFLSINARNRDGGFIGTGYEYYLGWIPGLTWKTEYRFAEFRSATDNILLVGPGIPVETLTSTKYLQTVTSELVWRFNYGMH
jgi:outer membrane immunogenic protein